MRIVNSFVVGCALAVGMPSPARANDAPCGLTCYECVGPFTQAYGYGPPRPGHSLYRNDDCVVIQDTCDECPDESLVGSAGVLRTREPGWARMVAVAAKQRFGRIFLDRQRNVLVVRAQSCNKGALVVASVLFLTDTESRYLSRLGIPGIEAMNRSDAGMLKPPLNETRANARLRAFWRWHVAVANRLGIAVG